MTDEDYMRAALTLAGQGRGWVNPNPMVGAVLVKEGKIIGRGCHMRYGGPHAERNALADCYSRMAHTKEDLAAVSPDGATLYVTLEPCCHYGKTPPCTEAILAAGIKKVVIGALDPNPAVSGKGIKILRDHGVLVEEGILREECEEQNKIFFHYMTQKRPYVVQKYAMTMDGKIAAVTGESKWITGKEAREQVHRQRHELMGIMVGVGTVLADNPRLNCRIPGLKSPVRIICDTSLRTPLNAAVVKTAGEQKTVIATCCEDRERIKAYEDCGCEVLRISGREGHVSLTKLMEVLGQRGIDSILLEGGGELNWSALREGIVNEVHTYLAPKIFGGKEAKTPVAGEGVELPDQAFLLEKPSIEIVGTDICVKYKVSKEGRIKQEARACLPES